jgi:putative RecB family exonuclease
MPTKPKAAAKKLTAWSYSRFSDYRKCPLMARYKHIDKIKEPDNEHQARGTIIHKEAELWSTGKTSATVKVAGAERIVKVSKTKIPKSLECFKAEFAHLRKIKRSLATEQQVGFDAKWELTEWFDSDAREKGLPLPVIRVTMDCRYVYDGDHGRTMKIIDYKTGQVREENKEQLSLYGAAGFVLDSTIDAVEAELWYLDQGHLEPLVYKRADDADRLREEWDKKTKKMLTDVQFRPTPSNMCTFCWFGQKKKASSNGPGLCKF